MLTPRSHSQIQWPVAPAAGLNGSVHYNDRDGQRRHDAVSQPKKPYTRVSAKAYEFLNRKLFDGELPNYVITPNRFNGRGPLLFHPSHRAVPQLAANDAFPPSLQFAGR